MRDQKKSRWPTKEEIEAALAKITYLELQQEMKAPGVTEELVRKAKNAAADLVNCYIGAVDFIKNTYAVQGDYKTYLEHELVFFPGLCWQKIEEETKQARDYTEQTKAYMQAGFDIPAEVLHWSHIHFHRARNLFETYFHQEPAVPWTLLELEQMLITKEFIENAPVKEPKKSKRGQRVRSSIDV